MGRSLGELLFLPRERVVPLALMHICGGDCVRVLGNIRMICVVPWRLARRLCSRYCDPGLLVPLLACRSIAIDKNPGVRPIGVGEVVHKVIAKAAIRVAKPYPLDTVGSKQLYIGQVGGEEAAIHSVRSMLKDDEAVILVDASNAFNALNRGVALFD